MKGFLLVSFSTNPKKKDRNLVAVDPSAKNVLWVQFRKPLISQTVGVYRSNPIKEQLGSPHHERSTNKAEGHVCKEIPFPRVLRRKPASWMSLRNTRIVGST